MQPWARKVCKKIGQGKLSKTVLLLEGGPNQVHTQVQIPEQQVKVAPSAPEYPYEPNTPWNRISPTRQPLPEKKGCEMAHACSSRLEVYQVREKRDGKPLLVNNSGSRTHSGWSPRARPIENAQPSVGTTTPRVPTQYPPLIINPAPSLIQSRIHTAHPLPCHHGCTGHWGWHGRSRWLMLLCPCHATLTQLAIRCL